MSLTDTDRRAVVSRLAVHALTNVPRPRLETCSTRGVHSTGAHCRWSRLSYTCTHTTRCRLR